MESVCQRCGAHITRSFRVGDFVFGSECVGKVDEALIKKLYGERLELADAIHQWATRILKSRAKGMPKNLQVDVAAIPEVGTEVKNASGFHFTVVGYTGKGIRVKGFMAERGQEFYNDISFSDAHKLIQTAARA